MSGMEQDAPPTPRLVRRRDGRMIAGVCQGVADHFRIDPLFVRIGFVVAAFFGGAGVIAYVAGWLLVPEEDETTSVGERVLREHHWGRIAGIVLIAIAVTSFGGPFWWFRGGSLFAVLLIVGGVMLLSPGLFDRSDRPDRPVAGPPAPPASPPSEPPPPPTTVSFDQPPPPPPPAPPGPDRRRRGGIGAITLGLLFVGGGIVGLAVAAGHSVNPTNVFAIGLIVVGAAMVISAWVGRSFILIPIGLLLIGLMSVSTVIDVPIRGGIGEKRVDPFLLSDLHEEYHHGIGEMRLDLTHVDFPRGTTTHVKATLGIGHLRIAVPRDVTVVLHGHAGMGDVRFLDDHEGGFDVNRDVTLPSTGESTPRLDIDADIGIGQIEVTDAAS
jgi:phage shock protein PspC (stress-responsive transcriptional regulator)/predicted membrane protein